MPAEIWVNIVSGNGLLPDGTKPLPGPMLTSNTLCFVVFTWKEQVLMNLICDMVFRDYAFKITII